MSRKKIILSKTDECKLLICEMTAEDIESVIAYGSYWAAQLRKREKQLAKDTQKGQKLL